MRAILLAVLLLGLPVRGLAQELSVVTRVPAQQPFGERLTVHSAALGKDMIVTVTPPLTGLPKDGKVAAIYALDEGYGVAGPAGSAMAGGEAMAPVIVVAVGWVPGHWDTRDEDLQFGDVTEDRRTFHGRGPAFEAFLLKELKPFVEANYPADPAKAVLFGHSDAGVFATEVLARHADAFAGFIIASPGLWRDPQALPGAAKAVRSAGAKRIYLAAGGAEVPAILAAEARLAAALGGPGSQATVKSHIFPAARHGAYFTPLFADAFPWVLPREERRAAAKTLAAYAGTYAYPDGRQLKITARGDQLFADMAGFSERELLAVNDAEFRPPDLPVRFRFSGPPANEVVVSGDGPTPITGKRALAGR